MRRNRKILFITGSLNQTSQMHQISRELPEFDCWFSQAFTDSPFVNFLIDHTNVLDTTIFSGQFRKNSEKYLLEHNCQLDYRALKNDDYELVVYCSDIIVPKRMRRFKTVWVQEGMTDRFNLMGRIVKALGLPGWLTGNTAMNGSQDVCDVYCAASPGYKRYFAQNGTRPDKIIVTGIPNYDNLEKFKKNDFPHRDYVMVATTDMRETIRFENRPAFIKEAVKIANGRQLLFKLHPNEKMDRAKKEIAKYAPAGTLVFDSGNTNEMIANCCELITQYSTVVYTGMALGKPVHSWFDVKELKKLTPIQNGGASARNIAGICRRYALYTGPKGTFNVTLDNQPQKAEPLIQLAVA